MFAGGTDVIGDDIVMGDLVPLFGMIPEVADILDVFAVVVDQGVVNGNDALRTVAGVGAFLKPGQTFPIERFFIPVGLSDPAIQAGLVGGHGKFPINGRDILLVSNHQAGQIFAKMTAFRFIGEQPRQTGKGLFNDNWKFDDSRHRNILRDIIGHFAINICRQKAHWDSNVSILQKFSHKYKTKQYHKKSP